MTEMKQAQHVLAARLCARVLLTTTRRKIRRKPKAKSRSDRRPMKAAGGCGYHPIASGKIKAVARMERSEIRGRSTSLIAHPGFHFVPSGLLTFFRLASGK
jgi:hypothetical protein